MSRLRLTLRMGTSQMACLYWVLTHLRIKWEGVGGPRLPIRNRAPNRNPNRCFRVPVPSLIPTYPHLTEASFFSPILLLRQTSTNCNQLQPTAGSTRRSNPYPRATRSAISVRSAVKPTAPSPSRKVTEGYGRIFFSSHPRLAPRNVLGGVLFILACGSSRDFALPFVTACNAPVTPL